MRSHFWLLLFFAGNFFPADASEKKLIEFGWDEPDTAFMRKHIAEMEKTPFDGCIFHANYIKPDGSAGMFLWECWGTNTFTEAQFKSALEDLRATPFKKFKQNFLRFNVAPGNVDWFDDFSSILQNAQLTAKIARDGKCAGILFDIEQYNSPLFRYHAQRDAKTKSWELYATKTRQRGREVMEAFQKGFPGGKIFLTFGYSLPWANSESGKKSLAEVDYGLLAPFLDGMVEAAKEKKSIIDGCELAYSFKDTGLFKHWHKVMRDELLPIVAEPKKYHDAMSLGFGIWMDYDWRKLGWETNDLKKNFYTPEAFEASVREGLKVADEFVWIYTETPKWWTGKGTEKLPQAYVEALQRARTKVAK